MAKNNKDYLYQTIFRLFLAKHYEVVTIRDIEEATGMTRGAVFYYAPNKQQLFCEVVDQYFFKTQDLEQTLSAVKSYQIQQHSLREFIRSFVAAVERRIQRQQEILGMNKADASRAFLNFVLEAQNYYPHFNEKMCDILDAETKIWEHILTKAKDSGEIRQDTDLRCFARIFQQLFIGVYYKSSLTEGVDTTRLEQDMMTIYRLIEVVK